MPQMKFNGTRVGGALVPYIGPNGNWWVGKTDMGVSANFSGTVYTPIKGVDYFTEEDIKELLEKADTTTVMKTILSNIGDMENLSDESAESIVEAINNYAEALAQLQIQIIRINNHMVNEHINVDNIHMQTYYSVDEIDTTLQGPLIWNHMKSSYPIKEVEDTATEDSGSSYTLESEDTDNIDDGNAVYALDQDNTYVTVTNVSQSSDNEDISSIEEGTLVASLSSETL